jgi:hypothetical protein
MSRSDDLPILQRANIVRHADSDRAEAIGEIQESDEADSLGSKKGIDASRVGLQRAAQD